MFAIIHFKRLWQSKLRISDPTANLNEWSKRLIFKILENLLANLWGRYFFWLLKNALIVLASKCLSYFMSCSLFSGVLLATAWIYSGDAYYSMYEVAMNKAPSYSFSLRSPKYNREPTSVVIKNISSLRKYYLVWYLHEIISFDDN